MKFSRAPILLISGFKKEIKMKKQIRKVSLGQLKLLTFHIGFLICLSSTITNVRAVTIVDDTLNKKVSLTGINYSLVFEYHPTFLHPKLHFSDLAQVHTFDMPLAQTVE